MRFLVVIGGGPDSRVAAVRERLQGGDVTEDHSSAGWPFRRDPVRPPASASAVWIRDLHLAFPAGQTPGTRLVLTQSTYQLQRWLDHLERTPALSVIADADPRWLRQAAPESFAGRGPWGRIEIVDLDAPTHAPGVANEQAQPLLSSSPVDEYLSGAPPWRALHSAFIQPDPHHRLDACRDAIDADGENAALHLAMASTCMELQLLDDAAAALLRALELAPDWEAVHFELGKLALRLEDTEQAAAAFHEAARLMPTFAAALLNLGAALGELGRRGEALVALQQAVSLDPRSHTAINNLGVVYRDEGRLQEAAATFQEVIRLAPGFVFGYYNLGQTLVLARELVAARQAYEDGFARDPQRNPRQACRLAVVRAATGDSDGAVELLTECGDALPPERAADVFAEAESTLEALSALPTADGAAMGRLQAAIRAYSS